MSCRPLVLCVIVAALVASCARTAPGYLPTASPAHQETMPVQASEVVAPTTGPLRTSIAQPGIRPPNIVCLATKQGFPSGARGTLVLGTLEDDLLLLDLDTQERNSLVRPNKGHPSALNAPLASPDWMHFAFQDDQRSAVGGDGSRTLRVVDSTGKDIINTPWDPEWGDTTGWISNSVLALTAPGSPNTTIVARDVFAGVDTVLALDFPDLNTIEPIPWYFAQPLAAFDPSLTRAVYAGNEHAYVLWDLHGEQALWSVSADWSPEYPVWSPDGAYFAVVADWLGTSGRSKLLVVSREGVVERAIDSNWEDSRGPYAFGNPAWDPTSSRIAFDVIFKSRPISNRVSSVAVLDIETGSITDYCQEVAYSFKPVWSPDGRYIAGSTGIIVDTEAGSAYRLEGELFPFAWLGQPDG